jgi:hypothetical protein
MRLFQGRPVRAVERIADACEADERVLDHLALLGCDPSTPRETTHYVYLPKRIAAEMVAGALHHEGWLARVEGSVDDAWLVVATRVCTLTSVGVQETRAALQSLASEHGGVYDGWEARTD